MKFNKSLFLFCCFGFLASCILQSPQKRAQRKFEKEKYEKADLLLRRSLEKDSLNPAAHLLLSRLYLDTAWRQDIDSAQYWILTALEELPQADKKDLRRLRKIKADSADLEAQLLLVDSAAFNRATDEHSVEAYNYFIDRFAEAPQIPEATLRRNALAFRAAEEKNTYQAYQEFFQTYPMAVEAPEARERYEELLFIANTKTGTLDAYIRFLKDYPETPYRNRLLKNIYLLSTAGHAPQQYARFIQQYPSNTYAREALNQLYHLHKEQNTPSTFKATYPNIPLADSLKQVISLEEQVALAVLADGKWQFINEAGELILPAVFDDVHPDYLCQTSPGDYIEAIRGVQPVVVAKNGTTILEQDYESLEDIGSGLLRIQQEGKQGLYLKSGKLILAPSYEKVEHLGRNLLQVEEYGRKGILTHNGQWLAEPTHDSLARLEDFILFFKKGRMAVSSVPALIKALQKNLSPAHEYIYAPQAVLADSAHLIVRTPEGDAGLLNKELQMILPAEAGQIQAFNGGWIAGKDGQFQVFGKEGQNLLNAYFRGVKVREPWIAYKTDSLWGLYNIRSQKATFDVYDSLTLLHPNILVVHNKKETTALFIEQDTVSVNLNRADDYRLLRPLKRAATGEKQQAYLLVTDGNAKKVYNSRGQLIVEGRYKEVLAPDQQLLMLKTGRGAAIADSAGTILLKPVYDAVGNYQDGYFATLENSRFGIFNPNKNVHIRPQYQVALRPYSDSLLMAGKNKSWGIIDLQNRQVLSFDYEQLQYWSDTVALAQKEKEWLLVNLRTGEKVAGPFVDYKLLKQSPEETLAIVYTKDGYGVYSSRRGELISPNFDDIINLGSVSEPLFYSEKKVKEAELYVVVYINARGEAIFKQAYPREEWQRLLCD